MQLQLRNELEYEPEQGLVRYLDVPQDDSLKLGEMRIPLTESYYSICEG